MPRPPVRSLALALLLVPGARAQEAGNPPPLSLTTTSVDLAEFVFDLLPATNSPEAPQIESGEYTRMVFGADRTLEVTVDELGKTTPIVRLRVRPRELKQLLRKEDLGRAFRITRAKLFSYLVLGVGSDGEHTIEPRYAARTLWAITEFPQQIESLALDVNPRTDGVVGHTVRLELQPAKDTWLGRLVEGVTVNPRGAHLLRSPTAALSVAVAIESKRLAALLAPLGETMATWRGKSKAERQRFRPHIAKRLAAMDGTYSLSIDGPGRYIQLIGLRDVPAFNALADSDLGRHFDVRRFLRDDVEFAVRQPAPLQDTRLEILRKETDYAEFLTVKPKNAHTTYLGVVGDFRVKARLPETGIEAKKLVTRIRKQRLRRLPLPGQALALAEAHLPATRLREETVIEELTEWLAPTLGRGFVTQAFALLPEHATLRLHKRRADGRSRLVLSIETRNRR